MPGIEKFYYVGNYYITEEVRPKVWSFTAFGVTVQHVTDLDLWYECSDIDGTLDHAALGQYVDGVLDECGAIVFDDETSAYISSGVAEAANQAAEMRTAHYDRLTLH